MDKMPWYAIFLESFPEAMVFMSVGLVLVGYNIRRNFKRVAFTSLIFSMASFIIRSLPIPFGIHTLIQILILIVLVKLLLKLTMKISSLVIIVGSTLLILFEFISIEIFSRVFNVTPELLTSDNLMRTFFPYIHLTFLTILAVFFKKNDISILPLFYKFKSKKFRAIAIITTLIIVLSLLTILLYGNLFIYGYRFKIFTQTEGIRILNVILLIFLLIMPITIKNLLKLTETQAIMETQDLYISSLNDLYNSLRSQRHDFINQVQIIYALINNNEFNEAKDYIKNISNSVSTLTKVIQVKNPVITALLQTKMVLAETTGINFEISIKTNFEELPMTTMEFTRILGNLLDNAFDASNTSSSNNKSVFLTATNTGKFYIIEVSNCGKPIPEDMLNKILENGVTTKVNHTGLGLAIIKKIVEKYKGDIGFISNEKETKFTIVIPYGKKRV